MNFGPSDGQRHLQLRVRDLCARYVAPRAAAIDASGEFPTDIKALFAKEGILGLAVPQSFGGGGDAKLGLVLAMEEISKVSVSCSILLSTQCLGILGLILAGTEEQKNRFLPLLARGECFMGYALTEPEAGSDAGSIRLRAARQGDSYVLNGQKTFASSGGAFDSVVVFARTGDPSERARGVSAFLVDARAKGFSVGRLERKLGLRGSPTAQLFFDDVVIPAKDRLGQEGEGFRIAMQILDRSRSTIAAQAVGLAQGAFDAAQEIARKRGADDWSSGALAIRLAQMEVDIELARLLTYSAATIPDQTTDKLILRSATAKLVASDLAMRITGEALEIAGPEGIFTDCKLERMYRDAKIMQIYEGTNEIQRIVIARELLRTLEQQTLQTPANRS